MWRLRRFSSGAGDGRRIAGAFGVVVKEEVDSGGTCRRVVFEFLRVKYGMLRVLGRFNSVVGVYNSLNI